MVVALMMVLGAAAGAGVVTTEESSATAHLYAGDISASDLMHGLTMTHYGAEMHPSSNISCVNDGSEDIGANGIGLEDITYSNHGGDWGGILDFGAPVDIGSVQTICGWNNDSQGNRIRQEYSLLVGYEGDPDNFQLIATVNYQVSGVATSKVVVYDDASPTLASNVRKIKFDVPEGGNGQMFFVEWDAFAPAAGGEPIPEPAGLGLMGIVLLGLRKKRC